MIRRLLSIPTLAVPLLLGTVLSAGAQELQPAISSQPAMVAIPPDWDTFSVDITMRQSRVSADGTPAQVSAPQATFRFERTRSGDGWTTAIVVLSRGALVAPHGDGGATAAAPQRETGMRIEDRGDGSPLHVFDRSGKELPSPQSPAARKWLAATGLLPVEWPGSTTAIAPGVPPVRTGSGREWVERFVIPARHYGSRADALEKRHGQRQESVRGLDRYVDLQEHGQSELLVDPSSALPAEANVVRDGQLVTHVTYEYVPFGPDALALNRLRFEHLLPGDTGERTATVMELNNVRFGQPGGAR